MRQYVPRRIRLELTAGDECEKEPESTYRRVHGRSVWIAAHCRIENHLYFGILAVYSALTWLLSREYGNSRLAGQEQADG